MSRNGKRDWRGIGCAALLAASIAFPLGLFVGGGETPPRKSGESARAGPPSPEARTARNPFSPRVTSDPYVIEEQRRVLRALEAGCSQLKQHCAEAEQARRRIEEAEAGR